MLSAPATQTTPTPSPPPVTPASFGWQGSPGTQAVQDCKILIVDDEPINIRVVRKYLQACGYERFVTTSESTQALELIAAENPDLVLLDIMMPGIDGLEILELLRSDHQMQYLPVLILTASSDPQTKFRALELGATDFLAKPVDPGDLVPRVRNALMVKAHQDHLKHYACELEHQVQLRTAELAASRQHIIHCLARAGEYRDHDTGNHVIRVGLYAGVIARRLGVPESQAELLEQAALLHDVGKIGISDLILLKPGKLTDAEFGMMKKHCEFGRNIIQPKVAYRWPIRPSSASEGDNQVPPPSPLLQLAASIAYTHHERWDGKGYPRGLAGEDIPLEGRITSVADVYDALSSERPYKPAYPPSKCFAIMQDSRGTQFDPRVFDAFLASKEEILRIQHEFADNQ